MLQRINRKSAGPAARLTLDNERSEGGGAHVDVAVRPRGHPSVTGFARQVRDGW